MFQKPLRKKFSKIKSYKLYSFDIETYNKNNNFLMCSVFDGEKFHVFKNKSDVQKFLFNIKDSFVVSTNLSFDFNGIFFNSKYFKHFKFIMSKSKIIAIINTINNTYFIDTLNFAPFSVEKLGKILNINKINKPSFLGKKPKNNNEWLELIEYNKRDAEISFLFINEFQKFLNSINGELKLSISSISMDLFQRNFLKYSINHEKTYLNDKIFSAYYGGRTEAFYRGSFKNAYMFDINSLYPSVMLNDFPVPESACLKYNSNINYLEYEGISNVIIKSPNYLFYPLLPYRFNNKLVFPLGVFSGSYTHVELREALKLGYKILRFNWTIYYSKTFNPFNDFINYFYDLRKSFNNNSLYNIICKLILNSFYGKFGQREINNINICSFDDLKYMAFFDKDFIIKDNIVYFYDKYNCFNSFVIPIFAVYTTAYGRLKLYEYICKYNALYCDTDSIITFDKNVPVSNNLGAMKFECFISNGIIVKPKLYLKNVDGINIIKIKGVPNADLRVFSDIINNKPVYYKKFVKFKESLRRDLNINQIIDVLKSVNLNDDKRFWSNSFFNPLIFEKSSPLFVFDNK